jgi:hypothetical protein
LLLDDSKKRKRGQAMQAVCWMKDPLTNASIRGHQYVTAVPSFRGHMIPLGVRLYIKKEHGRTLQRSFRKTTELAAESIRQFQPPNGVRGRVLFDSFYLCPAAAKTCRAQQFHFLSTLKSNRKLFQHGRKLKADFHGRSLFRRGRIAAKSFSLTQEHGSVTTSIGCFWPMPS